jgi:hypothetical protein
LGVHLFYFGLIFLYLFIPLYTSTATRTVKVVFNPIVNFAIGGII